MQPPKTTPIGAGPLSNEPFHRPKQHEQHQAQQLLATGNAVAAMSPPLMQSSHNDLAGWGMHNVGNYIPANEFGKTTAPGLRGNEPQSVKDIRGYRAPPAVSNPLTAAAAATSQTLLSAKGGMPGFAVDGGWSAAPFSMPGPGSGNYAAVVDHSWTPPPGPGLLSPTQQQGIGVGMFRGLRESQDEYWTAGLQQPKYAARLGSHGLVTDHQKVDHGHANLRQSQAAAPSRAPPLRTDDQTGRSTQGQASRRDPVRDYIKSASLGSPIVWDDRVLSEFVDDTAAPPVFVDPTMSTLPGRPRWPSHAEAAPIYDRPSNRSSVHHNTLHFAPADTSDYGKTADCRKVRFITLLTFWSIRFFIRTAIPRRRSIVR